MNSVLLHAAPVSGFHQTDRLHGNPGSLDT